MDVLVCCVSIYPWGFKDMLHTIDAIGLSSMLLLLKLLGLSVGIFPKFLLLLDYLKEIVTL